MQILGKATGSVLLAVALAGAAVWSVKADTLTPSGGTPFTDAQFSGVALDGTQSITLGMNDDVFGCPETSPQPACLDLGSVDIFFGGGSADGLLVRGGKFWADITGNLSSILTSFTTSGVVVAGSVASLTGLGGQACFESTISPALPTEHGVADAVCTTGSQPSNFALTQIAPDTFEASNGSIGVTFSLAGSLTSTPEPGSFAMLLTGLAGLGLASRRFPNHD
jgi:hypothetical protein